MKLFKVLSLSASFLFIFNASASEVFLHNFIKEYNDKKSYHLGPNCFATAAAATNILPYAGYMDGKQFQLLMNGPACEKLDTNRELKQGDILLVFQDELIAGKKYRTPLHTLIYLDEKRVFEKASNASSTRPNIISPKESLAPYSDKTINELRRDQGHKIFIETYSCINYQEALEKNFSSWYKKYRRSINQLFLRDQRIAKMVQTRYNNEDAIRMMVSALSGNLRTLNYIQQNRETKSSFEYPHKLSLNNKMWIDAPGEVVAFFQYRFTDMIFQLQNMVYTNILAK